MKKFLKALLVVGAVAAILKETIFKKQKRYITVPQDDDDYYDDPDILADLEKDETWSKI